ncbi:MAG: tRNA uridine-5-carboxymethylaminomethyl(34) synthesis GTPase MnmE [Lentisphaeria bacterium]|nr:tRNA uridine-5-carboxymethylaminomethyl(34) synthesis GTPase MnmE [Lentisphaeria bacterium]
MTSDTICAIATAIGGAVSIIRLSGPAAIAIAGRVWHGRTALAALPARQLTLGRLCRPAGGVIDPQCLAVVMPGPHSYTGEDVVELHCHGGALCTRLALEELLRQGARHADPGEFTRRAFVNGRLDLTQAEAVADIISAGSESALRLAGRQLEGALGRRINASYESLTEVLAEIESRLDFPEEELDWQSTSSLQVALQAAQDDLRALAASRHDGEILRGGISLVIAGPPNVGKSSLLNVILGRDRAIVAEIAGTTRDTIEVPSTIRGIPIHLVDTAGIRAGGDSIERAGMARTESNALSADLILWVYDASQPYAAQRWPEWPIAGKLIVVANKCDKAPAVEQGGCVGTAVDADADAAAVRVSALYGTGLPALYDAIERAVWQQPQGPADNALAVAARHGAHLERAVAALDDARQAIGSDLWELAAPALRSAIFDLGKILGRSVDPDVLDTIFARFCIGK